jgi:osmotically-inducible protein OsmY
VKAALQADPSLQGAEIAIETMNGEVQLNGYVGNPADVDKATAIAGSVEGVTNVKNNLQPK